jgi:ParB family chromosome partitioning protein
VRKQVSEEGKKRQLGRGLSALLGEDRAAETITGKGAGSRMLPIESLHPSPYQPRRIFTDEGMASLVQSVKQQGIVQPLLVRPDPTRAGEYEIVAGERRWRAAQAAQLHEVPAVVRELGDRDTLEIALVENIQREDLSPLEEARGYRRLIDEFGHTQEELANALGKSRSHVANLLRLLTLPESVQQMLSEGKLSAGHARALITAAEPERLAERIVAKGLSVRDAERLAQEAKPGAPSPAKPSRVARAIDTPESDPDTLALERDLSLLLGMKVTIRHEGKGGDISIRYESMEQLDDILQRFSAT